MAFTDNHLYFDDVAVGKAWESPGRTVTETDVVNFAGLSGDFNPIHVDHAFASATPFRRPIAHGMLVMSIGSGLGTTSPPMRTVAFLAIQDWQLKEAVFPGDTIRVRTAVVDKKLRGRGKRGEVVLAADRRQPGRQGGAGGHDRHPSRMPARAAWGIRRTPTRGGGGTE